SLGIPSNATMLYGHVETVEERVKHLVALRELQAESLAAAGSNSAGSSHAAFNCLIPLSFIPEGSELGHLPGNTGLSDLKTLAIARLILENTAHTRAFWTM